MILYKCQDASHYLDFLGLLIDRSAHMLPAPKRPSRRMECYGDSVSAGEVCEALDCIGRADPENHEGIYSNAWYSYAFITARKLQAELHDIAQGGIALLDRTGYFHAPDYVGMESAWDKLRYCDYFGDITPWDFSAILSIALSHALSWFKMVVVRIKSASGYLPRSCFTNSIYRQPTPLYPQFGFRPYMPQSLQSRRALRAD